MGIYKVIKIKGPVKWSVKFLRRLKNRLRIKLRKNVIVSARRKKATGLKRIRLQTIKGKKVFLFLLFLMCLWIGKGILYKGVLEGGRLLFLKETIPFFNHNLDIKEQQTIPEYKKNRSKQASQEENSAQSKEFEQLIQNVFTIDSSAYVTPEDLDLERLKNTDVTTELKGGEPKVLIFHTHSQEDFIDSQPGNADDTIVGVGQVLAEILAKEYGITVVHDVGQYDVMDGKEKRNGSYEVMGPAIEKILKKYPSIELCIDLHRDGVNEGVRLVTEINEKPTAQIMYFNGICRLNDNGRPKETKGLENPYIKENLALSYQMQMMTNASYPGFARKIYIKPYRYSLHMKPRSLLIEAGANTNTVEEVKNAMEPLAEILVKVVDSKKPNEILN